VAISQGKKEILDAPHYPHNGYAGIINCPHARVSCCPFYLHVVLKRWCFMVLTLHRVIDMAQDTRF